MTDPKELDALFDAFLAHLEHDGPEPDLSELDGATRGELQAQFDILRRDHGLLAGLPDLADDPVFAALGFDRAGEDIDIVGSKVRSNRQRLGIDLQEVERLCRNAGSALTVRALFRLEKQTSFLLSQVDATALAVALGVAIADLESIDGQVGLMRRFLYSQDFDEAVQREVDAYGGEFGLVARDARAAMFASSFREGRNADFAHLISLLEAVLERIRERWQP
jgi:hypothetical protein